MCLGNKVIKNVKEKLYHFSNIQVYDSHVLTKKLVISLSINLRTKRWISSHHHTHSYNNEKRSTSIVNQEIASISLHFHLTSSFNSINVIWSRWKSISIAFDSHTYTPSISNKSSSLLCSYFSSWFPFTRLLSIHSRGINKNEGKKFCHST